MKYPTTLLDQIKQRASLVEEVRTVAPDLKRKGKFWWACCPFHKEKSPSFHVREEDGHYHCFGCGAHGDVLTFVQETRGGSFTDAVTYLAGKTGIELPKIQVDPQVEKARNDGLKALARVQTFYQRHLTDVQTYIKQRGLTAETVQTFGLGFAPDSWDATRIALTEEGFSVDVLRETGLSIESDKGKGDYDRFRGRLMFPIQDLKDRVVAFGGRVVGAGEPKYLNSPDTPFFNKSHILYNLNRARSHIRQTEQAVLVEGYMDAIALWQAGVKTAVAPMGTAVTPEQIQLLWQYHAAPVVALDGDNAGRKAAARLAKRILASLVPGKTLRFMYLPEGEDPDSYVRSNGKAAFVQLLSQAISLEEILWQDLTAGVDVTSGDGRAQVDAAIQGLMQELTHDTVRRHYTTALKDRLWQARGVKRSPQTTVSQGRKNWVPQQGGNAGMRRLLALACMCPTIIADFEEEFFELSFENQEDKDIHQTLVQAFLAQRVAPADFTPYVEQYGKAEAIHRLCQQTLVATQAKGKLPHEVAVMFADQLKQVQQHRQVQAQRQTMLAGLGEDMNADTWQKLKALGARRVSKS